MRALPINSETTMFTSIVPVPGIGVLPINAFLIKGDQPILVDTGIAPERDEFLDALREIIDPSDLKWIWLTHSDRDHTGSLTALLDLAPNARVATHFITLGIMSAGWEPIPPERAYLVRDSSVLDVGDRKLVALRPPLFDNPGTVGFYDSKQKIVLSSDCFGAALPTAEDALAEDVDSVTEQDLTAGQLLWGSVDAPWVHSIDEGIFGRTLSVFSEHKPESVLSTHLPPIRRNLDRHVKTMTMLPGSAPFVAPDQAAIEAMMAQIAH
jgi:glyoxylase-like metal-dependent hydrolase (beta-lactamase superfamily II)